MPEKRLLLLSNSKNAGSGYLDHAEQHIKDFFGQDIRQILFVPFASVRVSFDDFAAIVDERFRRMGYELRPAHREANALSAVNEAEAIAVAGGNTFHLLSHIYKHDLLEAIRSRVEAGAPYIGWSAGSNAACPTIKTTNDMPIVEPPSFNALGLVPFQINPHYLDPIPGSTHMGETREDRIAEFHEENEAPVVGLREGAWLKVESGGVHLEGTAGARLFRRGREAIEVAPGSRI
ncbi:MAG TPA: dipeptidase PepE, partial [Blastocatellia bacterium]